MIDVGRLTEEETISLARECMRALTEENLFLVLNQVLTSDQKAELVEVWDMER
jgi:hypothetical protein